VYCGNHHQASRRINAGVVVGVRAGTRDRELHARTGASHLQITWQGV
jgi:hypothetical protein